MTDISIQLGQTRHLEIAMLPKLFKRNISIYLLSTKSWGLNIFEEPLDTLRKSKGYQYIWNGSYKRKFSPVSLVSMLTILNKFFMMAMGAIRKWVFETAFLEKIAQRVSG